MKLKEFKQKVDSIDKKYDDCDVLWSQACYGGSCNDSFYLNIHATTLSVSEAFPNKQRKQVVCLLGSGEIFTPNIYQYLEDEYPLF